MENQEPTLRVRINQIDFTVNRAGTLDHTSLAHAPVIRIYGDSWDGKKTCLHVHQVYPYIFIEYSEKLSPESGESVVALTATCWVTPIALQ
jgi:DNA polymerase zeta